MMGEELIKKLPWMLGRMEREASKHDPPVIRAEDATRTPFQILVFTMLSARTKDETTLEAVKRLFKIARTPEKVAALGRRKLERIIYGVGFHRVKAKHLIEACRIIMKDGMPETLQGMLRLPGVGRKTANIVLARAFGKSTIGVDVHVHRISNRLGLVQTRKPEETEKRLMAIVPERHRRRFNRILVAFGQTVCTPRRPACPECPLNQVCGRVGVRTPCPECSN